MDRETFLQRVRHAVGSSPLVGPDVAPGPLVPDLPGGDMTDLFLERLELVDGVGYRATTEAEAIDVLSGLVETYGATSALTADPLPIPDLLPRLDLAPVDTTVPPNGHIEHQAGYLDAVMGITGTIGGLAESGSVVLSSGPGRPRMASLIPLVFVALLREQDISRSLSHWIAAHPTAARDFTNLIVITGPSRTADIEQTLNLGVHGPKHVHVVVLGY